MSKIISIEEVIERIFDTHGDQVCILRDSYKAVSKKAIFIDKEYGQWEAVVKSVLRGCGNPKRHYFKARADISNVIKKIKEIHEDKVQIVENTFIQSDKKATFIDKDYGIWEARVIQVLRGSGHPRRADINHRSGLIEVKQKIYQKHGNLVTILEKSYEKVTSKAIFIDKDYGEFEALVNSVLQGSSHPKRGELKILEASIKRVKFNVEDIVKKIMLIHRGIVSLNIRSFKNLKEKCLFIDKDYGEFEANVKYVIKGKRHPSHHSDEKIKNKREKFKEYLEKNHYNKITLVDETFKGLNKKCTFIHHLYGKWVTTPYAIKAGNVHKMEVSEKIKNTFMKKYGVTHPSKIGEIAVKMAKNQNSRHIKTHWNSKEEIICISSYESKVVDYLNKNKIEFEWQPQIFEIPIEFLKTPKGNPTTYRPDLFLVKENKWIEIKGYFRKDALLKWQWFQSEYPNSELWDQKKLKEMGIL